MKSISTENPSFRALRSWHGETHVGGASPSWWRALCLPLGLISSQVLMARHSKNLLIGVGIFFTFSVIAATPHSAFATSGACSGHGGVNCAAGSGTYGQVICNDGWQGSSVSYASMEECQSALPSIPNTCTLPVVTGCTQQFEYTQLQTLCTQEQTQAQTYCSRQSAYLGAYGGNANAPCTPPSTDACAQATACESQINAYNAAQQQYNACTTNYTQQVQQAWNNQIQQTENQLQQSAAKAKQLSLDASCGANETYNQTTNQCECAAGDTYMDGECMTSDKVQRIQSMDSAISNIAPSAPTLNASTTALQPKIKPPMPLASHHSAIETLVAEAIAASSTDSATVSASATPQSISVSETKPIQESVLHKVYMFFVHLLGF